jgi:threonine/homoserine efflux transporter RhtA
MKIIGAIVLRQLPTVQDLTGIGLVIAGVAVHQAPRHQAARENQLGRVAHQQ